MFGHRAADALYRSANLLADFEMSVYRFLLSFDIFDPKLLLSLRDPKLVRRKFGPTDAIEEIFLVADALPLLDRLHADAVVEAAIASVLEYAEVCALNSRVLCRSSEFAIGVRHTCAQKHAAFFIGEAILGFLPVRLDGEIRLRCSDLGLRRVTVHCHEVASVVTEFPVVSLSLRPTSDFNHFGERNKMVGDEVSRHLARLHGTFDHFLERAPLTVVQDLHHFPGIPARLPVTGNPLNLLQLVPYVRQMFIHMRHAPFSKKSLTQRGTFHSIYFLFHIFHFRAILRTSEGKAMGAKGSLQKLADRKEAEIRNLKLQIAQAEAYLQAIQDSIKVLPKEHSDAGAEPELRSGTLLSQARDILKAEGKPLHVNEILKKMGRSVDKGNRISLSGSISAYARKQMIFKKTGPNIFTLVGMSSQAAEPQGEEDVPENFGSVQ